MQILHSYNLFLKESQSLSMIQCLYKLQSVSSSLASFLLHSIWFQSVSLGTTLRSRGEGSGWVVTLAG